MKLLLAEDTLDLNRALTALLTHEGYAVDSALDGEEAVNYLTDNSYDVIVLDIMMPKKNGLEVLRELRSRGIFTPVLLLTAKAEIDDRVTGLDAGADDYLAKPFAMKELLARLRSMTRRSTQYQEKDLSFMDLSLKAETLELTCENTVRLSLKEYELMHTLMVHAEKELSTADLLDQLWKNEENAGSDTVWLYICYLRSKLRSVASKATIEGSRDGNFRITQNSR